MSMGTNIDKNRYVGERYESQYGSYEIIEYVGYIKGKQNVKVRFDLTGTETICRYDTAYKGFAKDPEYLVFINKDRVFETKCGPVKLIQDLGFHKKSRMVKILFILTGYVSDVKYKNLLNGSVYDPGYFMYTVKDKIFHSNNYGDFKIIEEIDKGSLALYRLVRIKFILTGYEYNVRYENILDGKVKDPTYFMYTIKDKIFHSNNYGDFKVIEFIGYTEDKKHRIVKIKFIYSGAEAIVKYDEVLTGEVRDPSFKSAHEARAILGAMPMTNFDRAIYNNWKNMMNRCYNTDISTYEYYGAKGVTVAPEWHDFETFKRDIVSLPGWQQRFNDPINFNLDKDLFQFNLPHNQRVYSKHTCIWLHRLINFELPNHNNINIHHNCIYEIVGYNLFFVRVSHLGFPNYGPFNDLYAAINMLNYCYSCRGLYNIIVPLDTNYYMNRQEIFKHTEDRKPMISIVR